ncbi:MAG TPA: RNA methyltransferase [Terriglobia bacterium]|nr:RNA methyltransferase [Terriglobia bacterium]
METLSLGKHNPKLIDIRKAIDHGTLTRDGLLPIEGPRLLEEAQQSGLEIASVFTRRGAPAPAVSSSSQVYEIEPAIFKTIQSTETSQGIIALVRPRHFSLADIVSTPNPLIVMLARLQDPGNVGTILRVAESFGAGGCLATVGTASALNSKTVRASAGSVFRLPHVWELDMRQAVSALKASGVGVVGTAPSAQQTIDQWDWNKPSAIVIGNEGQGLSEDEKNLCDVLLRIPQYAAVESLNSAIAAAVILYEASKQRMSQ